MKIMNDIELIAFQIISNAGMAKSLAIEALREARTCNYIVAEDKIEEAKKFLIEGYNAHTTLTNKESEGEKLEISLIIMHALDQLMSAETIKDLALEIIAMYKQLKK